MTERDAGSCCSCVPLVPRFGPMPLAKIGQRDLRAWVAQLSGTKLAPSTVQRCYQLLSKVMAAAVDADMLPQSPCRRVPLPKVERQEMRLLTPAEVARLADAIAPRYRPLILLGAYGGLRIGEMAGLRRSRVDLVGGTVQVVEVITEPRGVLHVGPTQDQGRVPYGRTSPVRRRRARRAAGDAGRARGLRVRWAARWRAARVGVPQPLLAPGGEGGRPGWAAHPRPSAHGGGAVDRGRRQPQGGRATATCTRRPTSACASAWTRSSRPASGRTRDRLRPHCGPVGDGLRRSPAPRKALACAISWWSQPASIRTFHHWLRVRRFGWPGATPSSAETATARPERTEQCAAAGGLASCDPGPDQGRLAGQPHRLWSAT